MDVLRLIFIVISHYCAISRACVSPIVRSTPLSIPRCCHATSQISTRRHLCYSSLKLIAKSLHRYVVNAIFGSFQSLRAIANDKNKRKTFWSKLLWRAHTRPPTAWTKSICCFPLCLFVFWHFRALDIGFSDCTFFTIQKRFRNSIVDCARHWRCRDKHKYCEFFFVSMRNEISNNFENICAQDDWAKVILWKVLFHDENWLIFYVNKRIQHHLADGHTPYQDRYTQYTTDNAAFTIFRLVANAYALGHMRWMVQVPFQCAYRPNSWVPSTQWMDNNNNKSTKEMCVFRFAVD